MSERTGVEWTRSKSGPGSTWNFLRGCDPVSPGCGHCYACSVALRFSGPGLAFENLALETARGTAQWTGEVRVLEDKLLDPVRWQRPRRIFAISVSDPFHALVPLDIIARMYAVMALAHWHHFQVLTKRAERMLDVLTSADFRRLMRQHVELYAREMKSKKRGVVDWIGRAMAAWPLPNVTQGISAESQPWFDLRWPYLRDTPATVRMISWEPALGGLVLPADALDPAARLWLVPGGESNQKNLPARPAHLAWFSRAIEQCDEHGVPLYLKQLGSNPVTAPEDADGLHYIAHLHKGKGADFDLWPERLRVRQFADDFDEVSS